MRESAKPDFAPCSSTMPSEPAKRAIRPSRIGSWCARSKDRAAKAPRFVDSPQSGVDMEGRRPDFVPPQAAR